MENYETQTCEFWESFESFSSVKWVFETSKWTFIGQGLLTVAPVSNIRSFPKKNHSKFNLNPTPFNLFGINLISFETLHNCQIFYYGNWRVNHSRVTSTTRNLIRVINCSNYLMTAIDHRVQEKHWVVRNGRISTPTEGGNGSLKSSEQETAQNSEASMRIPERIFGIWP